MSSKSSNLSRMLLLVTTKFDGIVDKGGAPYVLHLLKVMHYTKSEDEDIQCIALGHDLIEDIFDGNVPYGIEFLRTAGFNSRIIDGIVAMTKVPGESYEDYKAKVKSNPDAIKVKMADLRHNTDIRRLKGVSEKDTARTARYHQFYQELKEIQ